MGVVPSRARKQAVVAQTIASPCLAAAGSRGHPTAAGDKMESYSTPSRGFVACPRAARNWPILKRIPMSEPYLGLLIGAAPDLPPLFESQSDDLEWMVVQTSSLTVALNCLRRRTYHLVIAEHQQASGAGSDLVAAIREAQPGVKVIVIDSVPSNADVIEAIEQKAFSYF